MTTVSSVPAPYPSSKPLTTISADDALAVRVYWPHGDFVTLRHIGTFWYATLFELLSDETAYIGWFSDEVFRTADAALRHMEQLHPELLGTAR